MDGSWYAAGDPPWKTRGTMPASAGEGSCGFATHESEHDETEFRVEAANGVTAYAPDAEAAATAARTLHTDGEPTPIRTFIGGREALGTYSRIG